MAIRVLALAAFLLCGVAHAQLKATVDPRVEFMSAVARTAEFEEYCKPNAASPYSAKVDALMAPFKEHAAIRRMRDVRKSHGLSYDAVMSLALHVGNPPELVERMSLDSSPPRLDARLPPVPTRALLHDLRDLAASVNWMAFAASQKQLYDTAADRLATAANKAPAVEWFDKTIGARPGATYTLIAGLLNGGHNYGVGVQFLDGSPEEIRPVIGCWKWDDQGLPTFSDSIAPLVAHELCHSYTNALVDRHAETLRRAGDQLFAATEKQMKRMAYGNARTVLYETLVRAMVVRYMRDTFGAEAGAKQAAEESKAGFTWVPALAEAFDRYDADRATYPTLDAFVPEIAAVLNAQAAAMKAGPPAPTLVRSTPADGDLQVGAGSSTLRLEFDRPMRKDSYSLTGSLHDLPTDMVLERTENDDRVFVWRMKTEPGRAYTIGLNGGNYRGFKSREGVPLPYTMIRFTTFAR
ncbi:MAG: DUF4932 domain-containing protein [Phycisphaerae bacterium]|nr:DUF4932 domain-containing protein [Phycisphaerae bacterium]